MTQPILYLGNINYSSWSVRAALAVRAAGIQCEERVLPLGFETTRDELISKTEYHKVPALLLNELVVTDSLAITEWAAELAEPGTVWPTAPELRAMARSYVAEMHSGFFEIRSKMPMDIRSRHALPTMTAALSADVNRVLNLWTKALAMTHKNGPYLFGAWSAADAFYAPVVTRFQTYGFELTGAPQDYSSAVLEHPVMQNVIAEAEAEDWLVDQSSGAIVGSFRT